MVEYRGNPRPIELNATTYRAVREGDEWRMCGEETPAETVPVSTAEATEAVDVEVTEEP
jgi:hypothetical protein